MLRKSFNHLVKLFLGKRYARIEKMKRDAPACQEQIRYNLLQVLPKTKYAHSLNLQRNSRKRKLTLQEFKKQVPLQSYEDFHPFIDRMMHGEKDVLWPGAIKYFSKSAGTTNDQSKYLPISPKFLRENLIRSSWDTVNICFDQIPNAQLFQEKSLLIGGALKSFTPYPKTQIGDISAIMIHTMPPVGRPFYTPDFKTAIIEDWEEKIQKLSDITGKENVVMFGGVPTWTIVLIKEMLKNYKAKNMLDIWPNAQVYLHGGVGFEPYKKQFKEYFPSESFDFMEIYNASEGYFAMQDDWSQDDMLLLTNNGVYFEFLPFGEWESDGSKTIELKDVEINQDYAMVITTSAGLWRYKTGDTIRFTSIAPHRIKISGRTKHFINTFGEEVMVGNTDLALARVCEQLNINVSDYTVAPIFMTNQTKGGHEWLIEFDAQPGDLNQFSMLLDNELKALNSDYKAKRYKGMALEKPIINNLPRGTFKGWLKSKGKAGAQQKIPRLYNSRKYVEDILQFAQS